MNKTALVEKVENLVKPIIEELSYELYHIEYVKENGDFYLRIYIDKEEGRISLNDCEAVSRKISEVLDSEDPIENPYYLEVSSPGLFRGLYTDGHFTKVIGKEILVKFNGTFEGLKSLKGILKEATQEYILVEKDKEVKIPKDKIKSANLEAEL